MSKKTNKETQETTDNDHVFNIRVKCFLFQENNYLFQSKNANTRKRCKVCSKLIIKILKQFQWYHSCVFIVNFEYISYIF